MTGAQAAEPSKSEVTEVVIVTGSFIRGTAEDAALPVEVIGSEELEKQGSPSTLDMIKSISAMAGIVGESNQFTSGRGQAAEGTASINLRGFGAARTLVLLNGKRLASDDANTLPSSAIARVEVLKDGAAATYGSDAIGGVVNFITKTKFEGLEINGDYRYIEDSDGDYNAGLNWGHVGERYDAMVSANYFHRSPLLVRDRDWAIKDYLSNPEGGWTGASHPTEYRPVTATGAALPNTGLMVDPSCAFFGGVVTNAGTQCRTQYTLWDNLVEEQNSYQAFGQFNFDVTDTTKLHVEALYAKTEVPHANTTPSYATSRTITRTVFPASITSGYDTAPEPDARSFFFVPAANPGFQALAAAGGMPAGAAGAAIQIGQYRPFLAGGNPQFNYGESYTQRDREQIRLSAELSGEFGNSINWTTSVTYGRYLSERGDLDNLTGRMQLALRGLGGPNCKPQTGTPGQGGCLWLNPFSNGIPANPLTGQANPGFVRGAENSAELATWMAEWTRTHNVNDLYEVDAILNGELGFLTLPGGSVGWAFGSQYRRTSTDSSYNAISSTDVTPCADTPINGSTSCFPSPVSPYVFLGTYNPTETERGVYAFFGELNLPIFDSFNAQVAGRFEDYGNKGGSTFNPKLSLRWQALDWLAFRGSVGTTFRAPPQTSLIPDAATGLQNVLGTFVPVETTGNPELKPEEATTFSVGMLFNVGNFRASADYWSFDISKILTSEPITSVVSRVFPNGQGLPNNCGADADFEASHFEFAGGVCSPGNITKVKLLQINGSGVKNTGVDVMLNYLFDNVLGGDVSVGASGTWIQKYEVQPLIIAGTQYQAGFDAVGQFNVGTTAFPLPPWRADGFVEYSRGIHNLRWTANYIDGYSDQRTLNFSASTATNNVAVLTGKHIAPNVTHDLAYRVSLPWETTLVASVTNIFNEDPSFARTELNYDPLTGNPIGRSFKIGLRKQF